MRKTIKKGNEKALHKIKRKHNVSRRKAYDFILGFIPGYYAALHDSRLLK